MRSPVLLLVFLASAFGGLVAQRLFPPIINYKIYDYKAATQNWDVSVDDSGALYAANNQGLLYFNGEEWALYKLPNETIIRSVKVIGERIYTGSYQEFGFWKKNVYGILEYTSLTYLIVDHTFTNEEIWEIIPFGEGVVFRSFSTIFIYANEKVTNIELDFLVNDLLVFKGELFISAGSSGVYKWKNSKVISMGVETALKDKVVSSLAPYKEGLLVGTNLDGCYFLKDGQISTWEHPLNELLKKYQLNKMELLPNKDIAFGTIKKGLFLLEHKTNAVTHVDREAGLQNNTVLSMTTYKDQLWLGLDNGIDRIKTNAPITYYTDFSGAVGTTYDVAVYNGTTFIGSNTGLYYFENNQLHFIEGSQGHVWDLILVGEDLLAGHNTGTFKVLKNGVTKVSPYAGGYEMIAVPQRPNTYLQGTYNGIVRFSNEPDGTWQTQPIKGLSFPVKQLSFEDAQTLWVAHPYKGFYRLSLSKTLDSVTEMQSFEHNSNINPFNVKLYNIKNRMVIRSGGRWFTYNTILDQLELFKEFDLYANMEIIYQDKDQIWFLSEGESREVVATNLKQNFISVSERGLKNRLVPGTERIIPINKQSAFITLNDGFGLISQNKLNSYLESAEAPKPHIFFFKDSRGRLDLSKDLSIPNQFSENISIQFSSPALISPKYQYVLEGLRSEVKEVSNGSLSFHNLPFGSYKLSVAAINVNGIRSTPLVVGFNIAAPWFWSPYAMAAYLFSFICAVLLMRYVTKMKLRKKQIQVEARMERQQEETLVILEKEKLAKEIKVKQNELTGTTLVIAKKNELLLELKNMVQINKENFKSTSRYQSLVGKIDKSINNSEEWQSFELHFNELHQDFFERLLKDYPLLTPKDLKLSAYLKMGLSSKEIAPLMGISVRGIEIQRYRLRKKLNIEGSKHLSNFLIRF